MPLLLPSDYHFMVPKSTRSIAGQVCSCRLCALGSLSGRAFLQFKWDMRARREGRGRLDKVTRMCPSCFQGVVDNKSHVCKVSTKEAVQNLVEALPDELAAKVVHSYLAKQVEGGGSQVLLPPAGGGHSLLVTLGDKEVQLPSSSSGKVRLSLEDILVMKVKANVSDSQMETFLADIRVKFGRDSVEPGVRKALSLHNSQYRQYFTAKMGEFEDSDGNTVIKPFIYCSAYSEFIAKVEGNRGVKDKKRKVGGDSGKGFFKLTLTLYSDEEEEKGEKVENEEKRGREEEKDEEGRGRSENDSLTTTKVAEVSGVCHSLL